MEAHKLFKEKYIWGTKVAQVIDMKTLTVTSNPSIGGTESFAVDLVKGLGERDIEYYLANI